MSDYITEFPLLLWLQHAAQSARNTEFPGSGNKDYWSIFKDLHDYMNNFVHNQVEAAAAAAEGDVHLYLTKHGPEHIKVVILRAETLIRKHSGKTSQRPKYEPMLGPYEVFMLLVAIHVHDIANRTGRKGHEQRILEEAMRVPALQRLDRFSLLEIIKIASCHGGKVRGNPDKINLSLTPKGRVGQIEYRPQLIAAILKLADELADDRTRADLHGLSNQQSFVKESLLFHVYAASLYSVSLSNETHTVHLDFKIEMHDACQKFLYPTEKGEPQRECYLLDYVYERTLKTYRELIYCMRFMRRLDSHYHDVQVSIEIFRPDQDPGDDAQVGPAHQINYTIGDSGYPDHRHGDLQSLAKNFDPKLTGEYIAGQLNAPPTKGPENE